VGGLTALAAPTSVATAWLDFIAQDFEAAAIWVPDIVLAEVTTQSAADANVNRFLKALADPKKPDRFWIPADSELFRRAGGLRTDTTTASGQKISVPDAVVVASAERLASNRGVTIVTTDPKDLNVLVDCTGARNIAVAPV
jgi:hypothetical protein